LGGWGDAGRGRGRRERPGGRERAFVYDTTVVARVPAGAGREDVTVAGVIERASGCQPVDRGWPAYALTDLDDRPLGRRATVDGLFDTPEPQPRPWRLLGAQPSGPLAWPSRNSTDAGGPDMPIACSMPMTMVRPRTT
jgi:hypothetical protein